VLKTFLTACWPTGVRGCCGEETAVAVSGVVAAAPEKKKKKKKKKKKNLKY